VGAQPEDDGQDGGERQRAGDPAGRADRTRRWRPADRRQQGDADEDHGSEEEGIGRMAGEERRPAGDGHTGHHREAGEAEGGADQHTAIVAMQ